jgi:SAM-dependent methyltransferase
LPDATKNQTAPTRSLDLGCGSAPELPDAEVQVGLDIDLRSLQESRKFSPQVHFVCADGERLPFRDGVFDAVISRVALPLMNLNAAIPEMSRVLKPEGRATLNLHQFGFVWRDFLRRVRSGRPQAIVGGFWAMVNGCIFHFFGRTFRFPFSRRFYDSFQTYSGMSRILRKHGFTGRVNEAYVIKTRKREEPKREIS